MSGKVLVEFFGGDRDGEEHYVNYPEPDTVCVPRRVGPIFYPEDPLEHITPSVEMDYYERHTLRTTGERYKIVYVHPSYDIRKLISGE